jgi:hypothetical protein
MPFQTFPVTADLRLNRRYRNQKHQPREKVSRFHVFIPPPVENSDFTSFLRHRFRINIGAVPASFLSHEGAGRHGT